jgi:hypothetical protein
MLGRERPFFSGSWGHAHQGIAEIRAAFGREAPGVRPILINKDYWASEPPQQDWASPANFSAFAKFCRVLDSAKCRLGILFSREGITGTARGTDAAREQLKLFQDRGVVVVIIDLRDLEQIADGANLITMLRAKYEQVRLDLRR